MRKWIVAVALSAACGFSGWAQNDQKITWLERKELRCLVENIYHEARGEPLEGQVAVARVTLNRVGVFADTVCDVVYQHKQFSWTNSRRLPKITDATAYQTAWEAAWLSKNYKLGAHYYHAERVRPRWAKKLTKIAKIGKHIFYV